MEFSVDVAALALLPDQLDRLGDDAARGRSYVADHTVLKPGEGLFNLILGGHRTAVDSACRFLGDRLGPHARDHAGVVRSAVEYYRTTDLKAAAQVDATIAPPAGHTRLLPQPGRWPGLFTDDAEPVDLLVRPPDHHADHPLHMRWTDVLSPTSLARDVVWEATTLATDVGVLDRPYDPFMEWVKPWLGDWAGLRACADVFTAVAAATSVMALNVRHGALSAQAVWTGNAADGCVRSMAKLHSTLAATPDPLRRIADEYRHAAEEVHRLSEACAGLVVEIVDLALMILLEAQAAAATIETVVGPIVLGAVIAYNAGRIFRLAHQANALVRTAEDLMKTGSTSLERLRIDPPELPPLRPDLPNLPE